MRTQDIYKIAMSFRKAIMAAKFSGKFHWRDRMSNFPGGCCDDSCDLLAYYLYVEYGIHTKQGNGRYSDSDPDNTTNHVWLVTDDATIIDITADQFDFFSKYAEGVYVGKENSFYKHLEDTRIDENYDIRQSERLWDDYQIVIDYMSR